MEITRLFDILDYRKENYPNNPPVFTAKQDGEWVEHSLDEYIETSNSARRNSTSRCDWSSMASHISRALSASPFSIYWRALKI